MVLIRIFIIISKQNMNELNTITWPLWGYWKVISSPFNGPFSFLFSPYLFVILEPQSHAPCHLGSEYECVCGACFFNYHKYDPLKWCVNGEAYRRKIWGPVGYFLTNKLKLQLSLFGQLQTALYKTDISFSWAVGLLDCQSRGLSSWLAISLGTVGLMGHRSRWLSASWTFGLIVRKSLGLTVSLGPRFWILKYGTKRGIYSS